MCPITALGACIWTKTRKTESSESPVALSQFDARQVSPGDKRAEVQSFLSSFD